MRRLIIIIIVFICFLPIKAQLSLDSCKVLAFQNNKKLKAVKLKREAALNIQKAARTKYYPRIDAIGSYEYLSKDISILNDKQKNALSNLGSSVGSGLSNGLTPTITGLVQQGILTPQMAESLGTILGKIIPTITTTGNEFGKSVAEAFETNTNNIWAGAVMVNQPLYMGGAITAANKIADIGVELANYSVAQQELDFNYEIEKTYWLVVSLNQKQKLADSYLELIKKHDRDVKVMIQEGVATRADGLKVEVKLNEAEMKYTQASNGLSLAKMVLCQLCGLPLNTEIQLKDEDFTNIPIENQQNVALFNNDINNRPDLNILNKTVQLSEQTTKLARALYLPQAILTGGYMVSNPNMFNGFQNKFAGMWNVGVAVHVPIWNWFEGKYRVRATKTATNLAQLELDDAKEKINLQIEQNSFQLKEAEKKLEMAIKTLSSAEENLRSVTLGFAEGVISSADVMEAQTMWQQAKNEEIDAKIEIILARTNLLKAFGYSL